VFALYQKAEDRFLQSIREKKRSDVEDCNLQSFSDRQGLDWSTHNLEHPQARQKDFIYCHSFETTSEEKKTSTEATGQKNSTNKTTKVNILPNS